MSSKTIIITGASRGIGFAIAERYAREGWNIGICSRNVEKITEAKRQLIALNPNMNILAEVCDMGVKEEVVSFGDKCIQEFSSIDILVNNAGIYIPGVISESGFEDNLEDLMKVNLYSAYWLGKVIVPSMKMNRHGHIFNIVSIAGMQAYPNGGSYAVTKFALQGYTRTLREELKKENIRVTGIYPGATYTDSWSASDLPESRFIASSDIAEMVYSTSQLSKSAVVEDIVIRPQEGDI